MHRRANTPFWESKEDAMNTITRFDDRRKRRSHKTQRAIELQLAHVVEEYQFEAMVVSDRDGLYLSHSGDVEQLDCIAAYAPYIGESVGSDREGFKKDLLEELELGEDARHVEVRSFPSRGVKLYVCVISPRRDGVDIALDHTIEGIRRIFRTTKAA
jgi:hypothetical protein